jgi:hypothetical protein
MPFLVQLHSICLRYANLKNLCELVALWMGALAPVCQSMLFAVSRGLGGAGGAVPHAAIGN